MIRSFAWIGLAVGLLAIATALSCRSPESLESPRSVKTASVRDETRVLVYSRTAGYRHRSIPAGIEAMRRLGDEHGFEVLATEDPALFTDESLADFDVVLFLSTTGDVLDEEGEGALERFVQGGGGWVGIHAASDTEFEWPWFAGLVGAYFKGHPPVQPARLAVLDRVHPSTCHLPPAWHRTDEWYDFRESPTSKVHVLATIDERSYEGGTMGHDHPIAWCHEYDGGRSWYTAGGHTEESFSEPEFLEHVAGGILWAAGRAQGDAGTTLDANFDVVVLDDFVTDPMELAITPDLRVLFVERQGVVKIWKPDTQSTVVAGFLDVFDDLEDGLLGVTIDPSFEETGWFWVYYAPAGDEPKNRLSRLTLDGDTFAPESEVVVLEVATQRDECCHSGGSLAFGPDGNLFLSTGDNTNPFASGGYAPIDEREGRSPWDAQKSSGNAADLRGKVLRITPQPDGSYTIPDGNLFPADGSGGRPEIYVMGCRNPFRISVDPETGWLYWGDVGPDAGAPNDDRGPAGHDEYNQAREAGYFGWPYFVGPNLPYRDYDFESEEHGAAFDPAAPVNDSPNNTGPRELPPAKPAWIGYTYAKTEAYGGLDAGGRCAMAGPVARFDALGLGNHPHGLPPYYDGTVFLYEWARNRLFDVKLDEEGRPLDIRPFLASVTFKRPHDLELGPDGRLYLIEWGTGFGGGNDDARIVRIDYHPSGQRPPRALANASTRSGALPLRVSFDASASESRNASPELEYAWDFDGDGTVDSRSAKPTHVYRRAGLHDARVTVRDRDGLEATATIPVTAGNTRPSVRFEWPPDGGIADLGSQVDWRVAVEDPEDGRIPDDRVSIQPYLGHDTHAHPLHQKTGLEGRIETLQDDGHGDAADLFSVLAATYTDRGAGSVPALTGRAEVVLQPHRKEAEYATSNRRARLQRGGGSQAWLTFSGRRPHATYAPLNLHGIEEVAMRVAVGRSAGEVELRIDAADGPLLGSARLESTTDLELEAGEPFPLRVEWFEKGGGAGVILRIEGPGLVKQPVPAEFFPEGVLAEYYELDSPDELPDFDTLDPYAMERVAKIDFASTSEEFAGSGRADDVGAVFTGSLVVPESGPYSLFLESDDGSRLVVGDRVLVDNDGLHGMVERTAGWEWREIVLPVNDPGTTFELFVTFQPDDAKAKGDLLRLDWLEMRGRGVEARTTSR